MSSELEHIDKPKIVQVKNEKPSEYNSIPSDDSGNLTNNTQLLPSNFFKKLTFKMIQVMYHQKEQILKQT